MKVTQLLAGTAVLSMLFFSSGCVVRDHDVVHEPAPVVHETVHETVHEPGPGYAEGYKEGYYDREHNRYWHENAWVVCVEGDVHCHIG